MNASLLLAILLATTTEQPTAKPGEAVQVHGVTHVRSNSGALISIE